MRFYTVRLQRQDGVLEETWGETTYIIQDVCFSSKKGILKDKNDMYYYYELETRNSYCRHICIFSLRKTSYHNDIALSRTLLFFIRLCGKRYASGSYHVFGYEC